MTCNGPIMGHLNSFSAPGGGDLNKNFPKIQMQGGLPGGMFKLRFDWYISSVNKMFTIWQIQEQFNSFNVTGLY